MLTVKVEQEAFIEVQNTLLHTKALVFKLLEQLEISVEEIDEAIRETIASASADREDSESNYRVNQHIEELEHIHRIYKNTSQQILHEIKTICTQVDIDVTRINALIGTRITILENLKSLILVANKIANSKNSGVQNFSLTFDQTQQQALTPQQSPLEYKVGSPHAEFEFNLRLRKAEALGELYAKTLTDTPSPGNNPVETILSAVATAATLREATQLEEETKLEDGIVELFDKKYGSEPYTDES